MFLKSVSELIGGYLDAFNDILTLRYKWVLTFLRVFPSSLLWRTGLLLRAIGYFRSRNLAIKGWSPEIDGVHIVAEAELGRKHVKLADRQVCTGCAACENVCTVDAIQMLPDEEGFAQPVIDSGKCVSCGRCASVCPILNLGRSMPENVEKRPMCGCTTDDEIWFESTSGGFFTELCKSYGDRNPVIFGASFDGAKSVRHGCSDGLDGLIKFRKSKYLQSDIGYSFRRCREFLEQNRFVVFSGVPCQIAGLLNYLGKPYGNLLTVEVICHGVCSPSVFRSFVKHLSDKANSAVQQYVFRSKRPAKGTGYLSSVKFENGKTLYQRSDLYTRLFLDGLSIRKSCSGRCAFRTPTRYADITLADARRECDLYPHSSDRNWSVVVANTSQGVVAARQLGQRVELHDYPIELLRATNRNYFVQGTANPHRDEVMKLFSSGNDRCFWRQIEKYLSYSPNLAVRALRKVLRTITGRK